MKKQKLFILLIIVISCHYSFIFANEDVIYLSKEQEIISYKLFKEIKCPVCNGQSIYDSQTPISIDLRNFVRKNLIQGKDEDEIKSILLKNYGDDILMESKLNIYNVWLWALPLVFLILCVFMISRKLLVIESTEE